MIYETGIDWRIEKSLKKGVKIKIKYGIGKDNSDNRNKSTNETVKELKDIFHGSQYDLKFKKVNTHSKILICDNKFAIIGSFNFLSFDGAYEKDNRDEISAIVTDPKIIEELRIMEFDF